MNSFNKSQYTCSEYREEMILLALQKKLVLPGLTEQERHDLEKEIKRLKKEMGME